MFQIPILKTTGRGKTGPNLSNFVLYFLFRLYQINK